MIGYPKSIATKADVENLIAIDTYKSRVLSDIQTWLNERYGWVLQGQLDPTEDKPAEEAGHKIVDITDADGTVTERYLYQWGLQETNGLTRRGITVADAVGWGCEDNVISVPDE